MPSKLEPPSAGGLGERLHAPVEEVAAPVEHGLLYLRLLGVLREQLADLGRLLGLRTLEALLQVQPARGRERLAVDVVHQLRLDPAVGAEDDETRPLRGAEDPLPHPLVPANARLPDRENAHALFPTLRRTYSPA